MDMPKYRPLQWVIADDEGRSFMGQILSAVRYEDDGEWTYHVTQATSNDPSVMSFLESKIVKTVAAARIRVKAD